MPEYFPPCMDCDEELKSRFVSLTTSFHEKYKVHPDFFVRVPGRVNLIGEHVDYNGYNVCPMAIKQSIVAAVKGIDEPEIRISNMDIQKYEDYSCKADCIQIKNDTFYIPVWYDYVLCGLKGILETKAANKFKGLIFHVQGTIPPSAGLSSSSALVCAAALSISVILNVNLSKPEIAELTAKAERYIGTEGGGMDQAIIFNGKNGIASHISFEPLCLTEVQIPSSGKFVIAQSMATKNKAASNDFNTRVVECRLSSLIIAKQQNLKNWQKFTKLSNLQNGLKYKLEEMLQLVNDTFHDGCYTKTEVCQILGISEVELEEQFLTRNTKHLTEFKLKPRALHVFGEAYRTETFCKVCASTKSLAELGRLMSESHYSLKDLYECSHPQLDELVSVCSQHGALGARLTGAGWGGCVVALVPSETAAHFVDMVKASFYKGKVPTSDNIDDLIFVTEPYTGATVFSATVIERK